MEKNLVENKHLKRKKVYDIIKEMISDDKYTVGSKIPSQTILSKKLNISRPTIICALKQLEAEGVVKNIQGAGTFIEKKGGKQKKIGYMAPIWLGNQADFQMRFFGVIIPIISQIASHHNHSLILSSNPYGKTDKDIIANTLDISDQLIDNKISGLIYTPLVLSNQYHSANTRILKKFVQNNIPVVLLDRDITNNFKRSNFDLVSMDHEQAGFMMTEHMIEQGCKKIDFIDIHGKTSSVNLRVEGYKKALIANKIPPEPHRYHLVSELENSNELEELLSKIETEAIIAQNDTTAAEIINIAERKKIPIPEKLKLGGFDDVPRTAFLTTIRQPIFEIAKYAVETLINRVQNPDIPIIDVYIQGKLIKRKSSSNGSA